LAEPDRPFYVGYAEEAPDRLAGFLRPRIAALLVLAPILIAGLALAQKGFAPSLFEFGVEREFVGWISERPVPALVALRPGNSAHCGATSSYPLVALGKFGAAEAVAGLDGQQVRLRGTLIHLDDRTMIELASDGVARLDDPRAQPDGRVESLGAHRFEGEIVDSKCYYGVMNPGSGKVHRACAARCISGGVPPALLIRDREGNRLTLLLVDTGGRALGPDILAWVGRPVALEGEVVRYDDLLVMRTDPATIEALHD